MTIIISKYAGTCLTCGEPYAAGQRIDWTKGVKGAHHARCTDEGKAEAAAIAQSRQTDIEDPADFNVPIGEGYSYLPYQRAGIAFALADGRKGTLFGDEMGLGKTLEAIGVINGDESIRSVLVICPKSLGLNWGVELKKFLARRATIILSIEGTRTLATGGDLRITIVNYDVVAKRLESLLRDWDAVILDEAHYCKNPKAKRTEAVKKIVRRAQRRRLALTGTPIPNKPVELWPILQMIDPEHWDPAGPKKKGGPIVGMGEGAGFMKFAYRFCNAHRNPFGKGWDFSGASRLDELQDKLRATCVPGNTKVATEYGPIAIRELVQRNIHCRVWSADRLGRLSLQPIEAVRKTTDRKLLVEVVHAGGRLRCTPDHRIFTARGYVRADRLEVGDDLRELSETVPAGSSHGWTQARICLDLLETVRGTSCSETTAREIFCGASKASGFGCSAMRGVWEMVSDQTRDEVQASLLRPCLSREGAIPNPGERGEAPNTFGLRATEALHNPQNHAEESEARSTGWLSPIGGVLRKAIGGPDEPLEETESSGVFCAGTLGSLASGEPQASTWARAYDAGRRIERSRRSTAIFRFPTRAV